MHCRAVKKPCKVRSCAPTKARWDQTTTARSAHALGTVGKIYSSRPSHQLPQALFMRLLVLGLSHERSVQEFSCFAPRDMVQCRVIVLYVVPTVYRFKYYFAWGVAESGLTLSGFNYNGQDDRGVYLWDRYVNARIKHVEGQTSLAKLPEHWNVCTGLFLRQCKVHIKLRKTLHLSILTKSMLFV